MIRLAGTAEAGYMIPAPENPAVAVESKWLRFRGLPVIDYIGTTVQSFGNLVDSPYQVRLTLVLPKSLRLAMEGMTASAGSPMPSWMDFTTT